MIDITMTSVIRPCILRRTLTSFCNNFFTPEVINKYNCRLIINIDPIGESYTQSHVANIARNFFKNIIVFTPKEPSFPQAVIRCWKNVTAKYCFHLEDDWILLSKIDIGKMINCIENSDIVSLRLNKERCDALTENRKFIYFDRLSLNPTLFKSSFIKDIVEYMDVNLNPEKQLRVDAPGTRGDILKSVRHGIYTEYGYGNLVNDIGRDWMKKTKFSKSTGFMKWDEL